MLSHGPWPLLCEFLYVCGGRYDSEHYQFSDFRRNGPDSAYRYQALYAKCVSILNIRFLDCRT